MKYAALVLSASVLIVAASSADADPVTLPHSFQSGTPAKAEEVNANFGAVKTAVDGNAADIAALEEGALAAAADLAALRQGAAAAIAGITVAVEGVKVGTLLSLSPRIGKPADPNAPDPDATVLYPASIYDTPSLWVLNGRGYVARIIVAPEYGPETFAARPPGQLIPGILSYADASCATEPFVGVWPEIRDRPQAGPAQISVFPSAWFSRTYIGGGGWVFGAPDPLDPIQTYMVSAAEPPADVTLVAWKVPTATGAECVPFQTPPSISVRHVVPNDPAVSGIPNGLVGRVTLHTN